MSAHDPFGPPKRSLIRRIIRALCIAGVILGVAFVGGTIWFLDQEGRTPREWAPYLDRRADKHRSIIVDSTTLVTSTLLRMDRLDRPSAIELPVNIGASVARSRAIPTGLSRMVGSQADLATVIANANPGDVIEIRPGHYRFEGRQITINKAGTAALPIVVRAARLGDVVIEANMTVVFKILAPYWRFENLQARGTCGEHRYCEHVFHVAGGGHHTVIRNNLLEDMNAQIKINGEGGQFPDDGVIEGNTLTNTAPRSTTNPITPIDLVAASNWQIRGNLITDFVREGLPATHGAFIKGEGENNVIERNLVLCEWKFRGIPGQRVGLSIGGGGTGESMRRQQGRTGFEQMGGMIRDNVVAFCNDVGIYVNRGAGSVIEHNTLLDTAGIDIRFPESSAMIVDNVVDGTIRTRDGGAFRGHGNEVGPLLGLFVGYHPARSLFRDPGRFDLNWRDRPRAVDSGGGRPDFCGVTRPPAPIAGAFEDWSRCR